MTDAIDTVGQQDPGLTKPNQPAVDLKDRIMLFTIRDAGIGLVLLLLTLFFSVAATNFASQTNAVNLLVQIAINTVLAVGMTFVILVGGIDLSVGSVLSLGAVIGAKIMIAADLSIGVAITLAVLASLGVGLLAGAINGYVTEKWSVPSFIVTLGMLNVARGAAQVISDNRTINGLPRDFTTFGRHIILGWLPVICLIALVTVAVAWFVLRFTVFGRLIYATGTNSEAVRLAGHNVRRIRILAYAISGFTAGLASIVFLLRLNVGSPTSATGAELDAIAAVILGGTSLTGGKGSMIGTLLGACLLQVLATGLQLMGLGDNYRTIVVGTVIIGAVILDTYRERLVRNIAATATQ